MRFTYGNKSSEVPCQLDESDNSIICCSPVFSSQNEEMPFPVDCQLAVTIDGLNYSECEESFKIYSNAIHLTSVYPKCGSVVGGSRVSLSLDIDP